MRSAARLGMIGGIFGGVQLQQKSRSRDISTFSRYLTRGRECEAEASPGAAQYIIAYISVDTAEDKPFKIRNLYSTACKRIYIDCI